LFRVELTIVVTQTGHCSNIKCLPG